jgi:hypothetical protein
MFLLFLCCSMHTKRVLTYRAKPEPVVCLAHEFAHVEALGPSREALDKSRSRSLALVELKDVLSDVGAIVGGRVPTQVDRRLGARDLFRRERLVGFARLGRERHSIACTAWKRKCSSVAN